ncbi:MAG: cation:proton antiporter [Firmicutes bacterium]|nr:cation:proton antiporter [Bacillota bacterium]
MTLQSFNIGSNTAVIFSVTVIIFTAFLITRVTKKLNLPNVTGYILAGVLIGPHVFNLIPGEITEGMEFISDLAPAFIAFGVGGYLRLSILRKNSIPVLIMTFTESLLTALILTLSMYYGFKTPLSLALLLGTIGAATSPASTIMTIRQYKAKGNFVNIILQVLALNNVIVLLIFSISAAIVQAMTANSDLGLLVFVTPLLINFAAILLGIGFGFILNRIISEKRSEENRLLVTIATLALLVGFCTAFDISPLLGAMAFGITYINISNNERVFDQIHEYSPVILTLFFVLSGMRLSISALTAAGLIGVTYFLIRLLAKYLAAYLGAALSKSAPEVKKYLGFVLIPQLSVSMGLAVIAHRILPTDLGSLLSTIILSTGFLSEIIGPAASKLALHLSGAIPSPQEEREKTAEKEVASSKNFSEATN